MTASQVRALIRTTACSLIIFDFYVLYCWYSLTFEESRMATYIDTRNLNNPDQFFRVSRMSSGWNPVTFLAHRLYGADSEHDAYHDAYNSVPELDEQRGSKIVEAADKVLLDTKVVLYNRVPKCGSTTMLTLLKHTWVVHRPRGSLTFRF